MMEIHGERVSGQLILHKYLLFLSDFEISSTEMKMASHTVKTWQLARVLYSRPSKQSDLVIVVERRTLYFYKQLLCLVSPVFKSMLCSDFKEKKTRTVNLEGKQVGDIVMLLAWIDPAVTCKIQATEAETLLSLADEYDISILRKSCLAILHSVLSTAPVSKLLQYLQLADQRNMYELKHAAMDRAMQLNLSQLKSDQNMYNSLTQSTLTQILESLVEKKPNRSPTDTEPATDVSKKKEGFTFGSAPTTTKYCVSEKEGFTIGSAPTTTKYCVSEKKEAFTFGSASATTKYCLSSELTDVRIAIEQNRLYYYSDVLKLTSSTFANKLEELDKDEKLSLEVGSVQDIAMILTFLDPSNDVDVITDVKTALQLLWLSLEYDIQILHEACENYLTSNISKCDEHDVTRCILLANRGQCSELMIAAQQETVKFSISSLKNTESYKAMESDTRIRLLEYNVNNH
ncbi:uncharacterized protein LOC121380251 isoform X2 [Gigantopelta aegis]|uniref:uncharacterized protein LOC121380251 isoform X2 n=1 Tax=Gigantopelta aegis TaxID=1735272 RepID=UPI001B88CE29|nr:uncharacterized protein LOC121380251 isoform X2 [Gigantopelta aegis]